MGTWGSSVFENDAAEDWMGELLEEGRSPLIDQALRAVERGSTEADDCSAALAAAEVVAAAHGWPVRGFPKDLKQWIIESDYRPPEPTKSLAIQAFRRVREDSELAELWKENPKEEKQWRAGLDDLLQRLQRAAQERPAAKKPKQAAPADAKKAIKRLRDLGAYIQITPAGHAKYVHLRPPVDDRTLAECLPLLSKTKVLRAGWVGMAGPPQALETSDAAFESLGQFKALQELRLDQTQVTDATLARLAGLTKLRELSLTGTRVTDAGLHHLRGLTSLESLSLGSTAVTDAGLAHLADLTSMKNLDLFKTAVTDGGMQHLAPMKRLAQLDLRYTKITGAGLRALAGLTDLEILELDHTLVDDDGLSHLARLSKLARLTVRGKRITDAAMETIGRLKALRGLVLEDTRIGDAAIPALAALPILEIVHLAGTAVTTAGARSLRNLRPGMTVAGKDK